MPTLDHFAAWLERDLSRFGKTDQHLQDTDGHGQPDETARGVRIFTAEHAYSIRAIERDGEAGYLGCTVSKRKPHAGEHHTRGNDLADGSLSEETWQRILADIVSYELQPLDIRPSKPLPDHATAD